MGHRLKTCRTSGTSRPSRPSNGLTTTPGSTAETLERKTMSDQHETVTVPREPIEWLKTHYPALCEKAGLCERIGGRLYTRTVCAPHHPTGDADSVDAARLNA